MFKQPWKKLLASNEWSEYAKVTMVQARLKDLPEVPDKYKKYCRDILATGSQIICHDKPPRFSDVDYMLLIKSEDAQELELIMSRDGYQQDGSVPRKLVHTQTGYYQISKYPLKEYDVDFNPDGPDRYKIFRSWKCYYPGKTSINLLLTASRQHFENFCKATKLAQQLHLTQKEDRINLFHVLCYDEWDYYG